MYIEKDDFITVCDCGVWILSELIFLGFLGGKEGGEEEGMRKKRMKMRKIRDKRVGRERNENRKQTAFNHNKLLSFVWVHVLLIYNYIEYS